MLASFGKVIIKVIMIFLKLLAPFTSLTYLRSFTILSIVACTGRLNPPLEIAKIICTSVRTSTMKSNKFQNFLKYSLPLAVILSVASIKKIIVKE